MVGPTDRRRPARHRSSLVRHPSSLDGARQRRRRRSDGATDGGASRVARERSWSLHPAWLQRGEDVVGGGTCAQYACLSMQPRPKRPAHAGRPKRHAARAEAPRCAPKPRSDRGPFERCFSRKRRSVIGWTRREVDLAPGGRPVRGVERSSVSCARRRREEPSLGSQEETMARPHAPCLCGIVCDARSAVLACSSAPSPKPNLMATAVWEGAVRAGASGLAGAGGARPAHNPTTRPAKPVEIPPRTPG